MRKLNTEAKLRITLPNRQVFEVPALAVAEHRSKYYSSTDEIEIALRDSSILIDWLKGDMNWDDLIPLGLTNVGTASEEKTYQELFTDAINEEHGGRIEVVHTLAAQDP